MCVCKALEGVENMGWLLAFSADWHFGVLCVKTDGCKGCKNNEDETDGGRSRNTKSGETQEYVERW